ncbi:(2Fe-2S)-binding protein [Cyclobacteriaceae bacterium YHN15]|jgi:isoquinoline 1-oxidoreductase subunit alpha|nr:(2Fe-2S)-binding protein [Cyclobacteriaceae bacterium YHN15]
MTITFTLNGKKVEVSVEDDANLLWTLRERLNLTGTKFGCGVSLCGTCTVHLDGKPIKSCITPLAAVEGKKVTTIEGLSENRSHPLQVAWIEQQVPQCGYCHSGQIMQAAALLQENPSPNREEIIKHMNGVLCRCGTYLRILKAIEKTIQKA